MYFRPLTLLATIFAASALLAVGVFIGRYSAEESALSTLHKPVAPKPIVVVAHAPPASVLDTHHKMWLQLAGDAHGVLDTALPDYPSARFRSVHGAFYAPGDANSDYVLCGEVDAKNKFGAYAGWTKFVVEYSQPTEIALHIAYGSDNETIISSLCKGHGHAGERLVAQQRREQAQAETAFTPEEQAAVWQRMRAEMVDLQHPKPWPVLPFAGDYVTDYSKEISYSGR